MTTSGLFVLFALGAVLSSPLANASPCNAGGSSSSRSASLKVPSGFSKCGKLSYKLSPYKKNFDDALKVCKSMGASMAAPKSESQNKCVNKLRGHRTVWLDFTDRKSEGKFVDRQGKSLGFKKWSTHEPNDYGSGEDCGTMWKYGKWNDLKCIRTANIVCQFP